MKNNRQFPIVLSIAGSDPSGGAGIQADLKTISANGGYAAAAITAVTAQNTMGVIDVRYMSSKLVEEQVEAVMSDLDPDAIKIGMTGAGPVIRAIAKVLRRYKPENIVLDPVMVSTSRHSLTRPEAVVILCDELFPMSRIITPNLNETEHLVGREIHSLEDMMSAAKELYNQYHCAVLVKGGDMTGAKEAMDVLCDEENIRVYTAPHIETKNLHGTGCTLSSAIATFLGKGESLADAVQDAKIFVNKAIAAAADLEIGHGHGPLWHFYNM